MAKPDVVHNVTFAELQVGDEARLERTCRPHDLFLFAHVSGNTNPLMLPDNDPSTPPPVAPSMWIGSLISAVLGNILPGPGTLYRTQELKFGERVHLGDKLAVTVKCIAKGDAPVATFDTHVTKDDGSVVCSGTATVDVPMQSIAVPRQNLPELILDEHDHFSALIERAERLPPMRIAVVAPEDRNSLGGAVLSAVRGLSVPILIGDRAKIERAAQEIEEDISGYAIIDAASHVQAAAKAIDMVNAGEADAVMKGNIHSDELLGQVVKKEGGLRGPRRVSHVFVMDVPTQDHLLMISDAAINIAPDLTTKVDIIQNAIDLAQACGMTEPRVGVLSAVETVNINIPSTMDAAILSKMAERGQIKGGIVDGPLAMDNAIDRDAARTKGITSLVAGQADILIVPNLEAGNMLAKELTFVARANAAGLVVGAAAPVILTSRADDEDARLASVALAQLYHYWRRNGHAFGVAGRRGRRGVAAMVAPAVLVLNAGSSSIKFAVLEAAADMPKLLASGQVDGIGVRPAFKARIVGEGTPEPLKRSFDDGSGPANHTAALALAMDWLSGALPRNIAVVGHRVVHGGTRFTAPVLVDDAVLAALDALIPLAPLHQPHNVAGIRAAMEAFPGVPQVACFDTAFHAGHSFEASAFALPRDFYAQGVRRYGFHGLSYEYIAQQLRGIDPDAARGRTVVAHLGNGSSLCALSGGRSIASTMGFTALDGVPMGTRSGQIDPGVLLYLMDERQMDAKALETLLYRESGLLGLSGISSDMRELEASPAPEAVQAIAYFTHAIRGAVAQLAAALGGLDCIVFTAGIGENSPRVREDVLSGLAFLGVDLDPAANLHNGPSLTTDRSRTKALVIATNEEAMIARHALDATGIAARAAA